LPNFFSVFQPDAALLPDPECPVFGLFFHGRIPPAVKMNDMIGCGQIQSRATGFKGQHKIGDIFGFVLERRDDLLSFADSGSAVKLNARAPEYGFKEIIERPHHFPKLGKDQMSPSRFSTGVPVRTIRWTAAISLTLLVWDDPGFLMACASSRIKKYQGRSFSQDSFRTMA
jgi:hypothetical protein